MRTNEERMDLIFRRTEEIQKEEKRKKKFWMQAGCLAAMLVLVVSLGVCMPGWIQRAGSETVLHNSGAASLIAGQEQLGYIVVGIVCFLLGCITTVILYQIKEYNQKKRERKS